MLTRLHKERRRDLVTQEGRGLSPRYGLAVFGRLGTGQWEGVKEVRLSGTQALKNGECSEGERRDYPNYLLEPLFPKGENRLCPQPKIRPANLKPDRPAHSSEKSSHPIGGTRRPVAPVPILARPAAGRDATPLKLLRKNAGLQSAQGWSRLAPRFGPILPIGPMSNSFFS